MRTQCTTHSFFSLSNAEILTAVEKACNAVLIKQLHPNTLPKVIGLQENEDCDENRT